MKESFNLNIYIITGITKRSLMSCIYLKSSVALLAGVITDTVHNSPANFDDQCNIILNLCTVCHRQGNPN